MKTEEMSRFLFELERGFFDVCYEVKQAYDGRPDWGYVLRFWDPIPKDINKMHKNIVKEIKKKLEYWEKNEMKEVDHYWRYFHGLTILGITEKSHMISKSSTNVKQQIAYELWKLDDGTYYTEGILRKVSWCFAEVCKNIENMSHMLEDGSRHQSGRKKRVHKSLIQNEDLITAGINLQNKEEVEDYVDIFCSKLENKKMSLKEYTKYLHVLTLLGVSKCSEKVPAIDTTNPRYDIAYELWALDSSEKNWKIIEQVANLGSNFI